MVLATADARKLVQNSGSPDVRQQLRCIRDEVVDFFTHVSAIAAPNSSDLWESLTPEDRKRGENTRRKLASVMAEMSSVIQRAPLLGPTALSSHQRNTRRMASALSFKRYECWEQSITYDEDIPIGRREAGESEDDISVGEAEAFFRDAFDETIVLLDLAEPMKTDTGAVHAFPRVQERKVLDEDAIPPEAAALPPSGRKRRPKPDYETASRVAKIVERVAPDGEWRGKLDDVRDALDEEKIPVPPRWRKDRECRCWWDCLDRSITTKAIEYRLGKAKQRNQPTPETLS